MDAETGRAGAAGRPAARRRSAPVLTRAWACCILLSIPVADAGQPMPPASPPPVAASAKAPPGAAPTGFANVASPDAGASPDLDADAERAERAARGHARLKRSSDDRNARSDAPRPARQAPRATHQWHDGRRYRPLVEDRLLEADFSGDRPVLRLRGTGPGPQADAPSSPQLKSASSAPRQSPVFRDASGQPRALPGGVIVVLHAPLDEAAARTLIASVGARPLQPIGTTLWLIDSAPGLPSLELANRLHDSGRFAAVEPNWWTPRPRK